MRARRYDGRVKRRDSLLSLPFLSVFPSWVVNRDDVPFFRDLSALFARGKLQEKTGDESNLTAQKKSASKKWCSLATIDYIWVFTPTSSTDQRATLFYTIVPRGRYCCSVSINSSMCQWIVGDLMNRLIKLLSNCHVNGQPAELHLVILIPLRHITGDNHWPCGVVISR